VDLIELCDPSAPGEYLVPRAEHFAHAMSALGVDASSRVVVYDSGAAMFATRLWWMLRTFGFDAVSVLDGGLREWRREGRPLSRGAASYQPTHFAPRLRPELVAVADVEAQVASGEGRLVNALSPELFRGEGTVGYRRVGRIPGSTNVPYYSLLGDDGRFRVPERLRSALAAPGLLDGTQRVVTYCGAGLAATTVAFGLALMGGEDLAVYDGSLSEWTAHPQRPVEVG
jgi:thiosulfate/3-mercaptopyruvate sulfurtransferase